MEEIADSLKESGDKTYQIRGRKFLLIYPALINTQELNHFLTSSFGDCEECYIAHMEDNTYCVVFFKHRVTRFHNNAFDFNNIQPTIKNIRPIQDSWEKVCMFISKTDPELQEVHNKLLQDEERKKERYLNWATENFLEQERCIVTAYQVQELQKKMKQLEEKQDDITKRLIKLEQSKKQQKIVLKKVTRSE